MCREAVYVRDGILGRGSVMDEQKTSSACQFRVPCWVRRPHPWLLFCRVVAVQLKAERSRVEQLEAVISSMTVQSCITVGGSGLSTSHTGPSPHAGLSSTLGVVSHVLSSCHCGGVVNGLLRTLYQLRRHVEESVWDGAIGSSSALLSPCLHEGQPWRDGVHFTSGAVGTTIRPFYRCRVALSTVTVIHFVLF